MPFKHIAVIALLTLPAIADVRLSTERPLALTIEVGPAAYHQESAGVASNGRDYLAVWVDRRSGGVEAPLFVSRLGEGGEPVEKLGKKLAEQARFPHIASAGVDYLVAWFNSSGSFLQRVDENGEPLAAPRRLSDQREPRALVSNGSTYLLLESPRNRGGQPPLTATILDRDGAPLETLEMTFGTFVHAAAHDGRYVIIDVPGGCDLGCRTAPVLHTIANAPLGWRVTSSVPLPIRPDPQSSFFSAATSSDRVLVTQHTHGSAGFNG